MENLTDVETVKRELVLIRMALTADSKSELIRTINKLNCKILTFNSDHCVLEYRGTKCDVDKVLETLKPLGVSLEDARDYAVIGCANTTRKYVKLNQAVTGADGYVEIGFTASAGDLVKSAGNTGEIQLRIAKSDWSNYTQTGDYSFDPTKTAYADWNKVTLYYQGALAWGVEPGGVVGPTRTSLKGYAAGVGWRRTLVYLPVGYGLAWLSEYCSIHWGFPYGDYYYIPQTAEQELWVAGVPFMDSLSYVFLSYCSFSTAIFLMSPVTVARGELFILETRTLRRSWRTLVLGAFLFVFLDLIIDPVALQGYRWFLGQIYGYRQVGLYFGVPMSTVEERNPWTKTTQLVAGQKLLLPPPTR